MPEQEEGEHAGAVVDGGATGAVFGGVKKFETRAVVERGTEPPNDVPVPHPAMDDGMADDLREAIRAKHRLVEQMKEDVKDGDRDGKGDGSGREPKRSLVWKIVVIIGIVVWILTMLTGASAAEKATRAMRARYAQRRALENEEMTKWRSERILRHFGLRRLSQLRHTEPVLTGDDLFVAVRDPDTHFLVVPVSHTTRIETRVTKNGGAGLAYVDVPIVSPSSYEPVATDPSSHNTAVTPAPWRRASAGFGDRASQPLSRPSSAPDT